MAGLSLGGSGRSIVVRCADQAPRKLTSAGTVKTKERPLPTRPLWIGHGDGGWSSDDVMKSDGRGTPCPIEAPNSS